MWYSLRQLKIIWYLGIVQEANLHSQKPSAQHTDTPCHCGVEMWTVEIPPDSLSPENSRGLTAPSLELPSCAYSKRFEVKNTYCRLKKQTDRQDWGRGSTGTGRSVESGVGLCVAAPARVTWTVTRGLGHTSGGSFCSLHKWENSPSSQEVTGARDSGEGSFWAEAWRNPPPGPFLRVKAVNDVHVINTVERAPQCKLRASCSTWAPGQTRVRGPRPPLSGFRD